jgi:cytochrome b561
MGDLRLKYGPVAMAFHWAIAILIIANFIIAWTMNGHVLIWDVGQEMHGPAKTSIVQYHKSIGITVLVLSVLRLVWRLITPPPPFAAHLALWEKALAHAVHWLFYVFMIGMPIAGWAMVSASTRFKVFGLHVWGVIDWPRFPGFDAMGHDQLKAAGHVWEQIHTDWAPWFGCALIAIHVTGALKHQFFDKDNELARMIPGLGTPGLRGIGTSGRRGIG